MAIIISTVFKERRDINNGIQFIEENNILLVLSIEDGEIFSSTDLRPGMEVLTINGESMEGRSIFYASTKLQSLQGEVWIAAKDPTTSTRVGPSSIIPQVAPSTPLSTATNTSTITNYCTTQPAEAVAISSGSDDFQDFLDSAPAVVASKASDGVSQIKMPLLAAPSEIQTAEVIGEIPSTQQNAESLLRRTLEPPREQPPPPGVAEGGVWGESKYCGPETICLGFFGCALAIVGGVGCIPRRGRDTMRAYAVGDMVYDENGCTHGKVGRVAFCPNKAYREYVARMILLRQRGRIVVRVSPQAV